MKKLLKFSLFALAGILFTATAADAQANYRKVLIQFDKVQNDAGIPGKSAEFINKQVKRSLMELNRMEVLPDPALDLNAVSKKPNKSKMIAAVEKPKEEKPAPGKKANTIAKVFITSFKTRPAGNTISTPNAIDKGGPYGENTFTVQGTKAVLRGKVVFKDVTTQKVVDSREFRGEYLGIPKEGKGAFNKATLLKKAIDKAIENFRGDVKYLFQGEFLIKEVLEGKKGDALNVLISGGSSKDIKPGYEYVAYTKKAGGKGKSKKDLIGTLVILNVKENEAMAKVQDGKKMIAQNVEGEGAGKVYVELK